MYRKKKTINIINRFTIWRVYYDGNTDGIPDCDGLRVMVVPYECADGRASPSCLMERTAMMDTQTWTTENTYFLPLSASDAANYTMLGTEIKIAALDDVPVEHHHFLSDLREIIAFHKETFRAEVKEDGSLRKSTSREVASRMEDLLERLENAGLLLCFQMWSLPFEEIFEEVEMTAKHECKTDSNSLNDSAD